MTRPTWPVAALLAAALAGCGDEGLEKEALAERASEICAKYAEQGQALGQPDLANPQEARDYFGKAEELASQQQDELEGLTPADEIAGDYERMTDATAEATALLGELADAAEAEDRAKGTELVQQLTPLSAKVDEAARAIGADSCAG
jgi:hypothetical protein